MLIRKSLWGLRNFLKAHASSYGGQKNDHGKHQKDEAAGQLAACTLEVPTLEGTELDACIANIKNIVTVSCKLQHRHGKRGSAT